MAVPLDRLLNQLNGTGLQQKDMPLFQVIQELIKRLKKLEAQINSSGGGGGSSSVINNITNIQQMLDVFSGDNVSEPDIVMIGSQGSDSEDGGGVPYYIAPSDTFTVPEYIQALFAMLIDNEGILDVEGFLIEVD